MRTQIDKDQMPKDDDFRNYLIFQLQQFTPSEAASIKSVTQAASPIEFGIACSDETTALTAGNAKAVCRSPRAFTITEIRATLTTPSTAGLPTINVKKNGATIFTTKLTIDATEKTSVTAATAYVLTTNPTNFAIDDEIQIDLDVAGTGATGLKIWFIGVRT